MVYKISSKLPLVLAATIVLAGCNTVAFPMLKASSAGAAVARIDGNVPKSNEPLKIAKAQFRSRNFGLAEKQFRALVEEEPKNAEAWLGLAAAYDQLRRFKLADRAYKQVRVLNGVSVALHNNLGYSYLLRGNRHRARREFLNARALEPDNPFVTNNLRVLAKRKR